MISFFGEREKLLIIGVGKALARSMLALLRRSKIYFPYER